MNEEEIDFNNTSDSTGNDFLDDFMVSIGVEVDSPNKSLPIVSEDFSNVSIDFEDDIETSERNVNISSVKDFSEYWSDTDNNNSSKSNDFQSFENRTHDDSGESLFDELLDDVATLNNDDISLSNSSDGLFEEEVTPSVESESFGYSESFNNNENNVTANDDSANDFSVYWSTEDSDFSGANVSLPEVESFGEPFENESDSENVYEKDKNKAAESKGKPLNKIALEREAVKCSSIVVEVEEGGKVGLTAESDVVPNRVKGRVSNAEGSFFATLGISAWEKEEALERLRAPKGGFETAADADARIRKILRGLKGKEAFKESAKLVFKEKDFEFIEFLARFKYATASQLRYIHGVTEGTANRRLRRLKDQGLVESYSIFGPRPIWFLTKLGQELSSYDLPGVTSKGVAYGMLAHSFVANHVAANLMGGSLNVLNLKEWPTYNRVAPRTGKPKQGEYVVSELEMQSSFGKLRMGKSDVFKPQLLAIKEKAFREWEDAGRVEESPEFLPGNEWMWVVLPGATAQLSYHVPDLVVPRPRNADGSPNSIAIEIELNRKAKGYSRTLKAFASEKKLYGKLIWVCRSGGPAGELTKEANKLGLIESGFMDIVPIIGEYGAFKGGDLWAL